MNRRLLKSSTKSSPRRKDTLLTPSIDELKFSAQGRWPDIFADAAGLPREHLDGRGHPCMRCGGTDRFAAFKDVAIRGSVQCRHCFHADTDPRPGDGIATLRWLLGCDTTAACRWLAGWLGLTDAVAAPEPARLSRTVKLRPSAKRDEWMGRFADECISAMRDSWWQTMGDILALPAAELRRLRIGWSHRYRAMTWPMVDDEDHVVGIRLRCLTSHRKWSVGGGKAGLFVPTGLPEEIDRLFIAEGPTDCAALSSLGLSCIGRPSCNGGVTMATKLVKRLQPSEAVIVADEDANRAGKRGAESLAVALVMVCPRVRIVFPAGGHKDARDWVLAGATADDVLSVVNAAIPRSLSLKGATP